MNQEVSQKEDWITIGSRFVKANWKKILKIGFIILGISLLFQFIGEFLPEDTSLIMPFLSSIIIMTYGLQIIRRKDIVGIQIFLFYLLIIGFSNLLFRF